MFDEFTPKNYTIQFEWLGGEFSLHPDSMNIMKYIHERNGRNCIMTNGAKEELYWKEAVDYLDLVWLCFHEETNYDHFKRVATILDNKCDLIVNWNVLPNNFSSIVNHHYDLRNTLSSEYQSFILFLYKDHVAKLNRYDYAQEQLEQGEKINGENPPMPNWVREIGGDIVEDLDVQNMQANRNFKGWDCWSGVESLVVTMQGDVYGSWCGQGGIIGNINNDGFQWRSGPITCQKKRCSNWNDLMILKERYIQHHQKK